ncbi:hypothetical protein DFJ63DRAFT_337514 [Scheffersomyces coipomensis]|uniref:uncharacterized protein n=1 Tax=Scheffersomyces coipomensis TaxID=1788519 RepID=UPI00315DDC77
MYETSLIPKKRHLDLPSPKSLARLLNIPIKKRKLSGSNSNFTQDANNDNIHNQSNDIKEDDIKINLPIPRIMESNLHLPSFLPTRDSDAPLLNSIPANIVPIIHEPSNISDYFTDVTTDLSDYKLSNQVTGILDKFPPPIPPFITDRMKQDNNNYDGIMVPFIYPPPPIINIDTLPYSLASFKKRFENMNKNGSSYNNDNRSKSNKRDYRKDEQESPLSSHAHLAHDKRRGNNHNQNNNNNDNGQIHESMYLQIPPLPFPPPNYMPYPVSATKSTLTPNEVFQSLLDAHEDLPRTNMVLASAAGSLFDLKSSAENEGFTIKGYERNKHLQKQKQKSKKAKRRLQQRDSSGNIIEDDNDNDDDDDEDGDEDEDEDDEDDNDDDDEDGDDEDDDEEGEDEYNRRISSEGGDISDESDSYRRIKRKKSRHYDDEDDYSEDDEENDDSYHDYMQYIRNIDTNYHDPHHPPLNENDLQDTNTFETNPRPSGYVEFKSRQSNVLRKPSDEASIEQEKLLDSEYSILDDGEDISNFTMRGILSNPSRDMINANGNGREKRRQELLNSINELTEFEQTNRDKIYKFKKQQLLNRLKNLQQSTISFTNSDIKDEELLTFKENLDIERDEELVRLKLFQNHELLKSSLIFYQDSNRVYKHLNSVMINKLEKLKNFFEFQRELFLKYLKNDNLDIFDIKSKDSTKLFKGISHRDFNQEIKQIIRDSIYNELKDYQLESISKSRLIKSNLMDTTTSSTASSSSSLNNPTSITSNSSDSLIVHDFMPLISPAEFEIITGDLPVNVKLTGNTTKDNNIKHQIFQNPLYDRITSGSDTNASDSQSSSVNVSAGPKRRGRRSNKENAAAAAAAAAAASGGGTASPAGGAAGASYLFDKMKGGDGPDSKYSEAVLLAKIMKQFSGPASLRSDELDVDFQKMKIKSKWSITK